MTEKTLKIDLVVKADPIPPETLAKLKKTWHLFLAIPLFASLASALIVGKKVEPTFPQEPLLPALQTTPRPPPASSRPRKNAAFSSMIACRIELERPTRRARALRSCDEAFAKNPSCSELGRDFAEILFLQSYALAYSAPLEAREILLRSTTLLRHCPEDLPLRKRAVELLKKL